MIFNASCVVLFVVQAAALRRALSSSLVRQNLNKPVGKTEDPDETGAAARHL